MISRTTKRFRKLLSDLPPHVQKQAFEAYRTWLRDPWHASLKSLAWFLLCSLAACTPKQPTQTSREISGTQAERIAAVSRLITKSGSLPSSLLNARFAEEQTGDGALGPSDFTAFYALTVAPADLDSWRTTLPTIQAPNTPPKYPTPKRPLPWWLTHDDFLRLTFYGPKSLTGRSNGWVGVAPDGRIFVYAFTM